MVHRHRRETHADKNRHLFGDQGYSDEEAQKKETPSYRGLLEKLQHDFYPI